MEMKNMRKSLGFTLMEILVVIGIVAVLAAISIPLYQNYIVRAEVAEGFSAVEEQKAAIEEFYSLNGRLPENAQEAGVSEIQKVSLVTANTWHQGGFDAKNSFSKTPLAGYFDVQMKLSGLAEGLTAFFLEAHVTGHNQITWQCVSPLYRNVSARNSVPLKYLPDRKSVV